MVDHRPRPERGGDAFCAQVQGLGVDAGISIRGRFLFTPDGQGASVENLLRLRRRATLLGGVPAEVLRCGRSIGRASDHGGDS